MAYSTAPPMIFYPTAAEAPGLMVTTVGYTYSIPENLEDDFGLKGFDQCLPTDTSYSTGFIARGNVPFTEDISQYISGVDIPGNGDLSSPFSTVSEVSDGATFSSPGSFVDAISPSSSFGPNSPSTSSYYGDSPCSGYSPEALQRTLLSPLLDRFSFPMDSSPSPILSNHSAIYQEGNHFLTALDSTMTVQSATDFLEDATARQYFGRPDLSTMCLHQQQQVHNQIVTTPEYLFGNMFTTDLQRCDVDVDMNSHSPSLQDSSQTITITSSALTASPIPLRTYDPHFLSPDFHRQHELPLIPYPSIHHPILGLSQRPLSRRSTAYVPSDYTRHRSLSNTPSNEREPDQLQLSSVNHHPLSIETAIQQPSIDPGSPTADGTESSTRTRSKRPLVKSIVGTDRMRDAAAKRRKRPAKFVCLLAGCSSGFTAKHNWQNHMQSHAGERPNICELCKFKFTTKADLRRHEKTCKKR
ncbi:hypothetical protein BDQ12DRAFT_686377 [Crucibulum laeve]|uniref:C2H2-type domain-containing protein n=1 Tax=Crucibulum laeve TaxID=68775 RepID=A0A5C3LX66_9AGAR|nr:hypothetical protein BDQ12DRAFT_686377 [Crucibulum laeve]